jgi:hypothetical protein
MSSWLNINVLAKRSVWPPLDLVPRPERIVTHEHGQFVVYDVDRDMSSHAIYDRDKIFPYGKKGWFRKEITDREALEAAINYAKEADGTTNPYRAMAAEIVEIQSVVDNL